MFGEWYNTVPAVLEQILQGDILVCLLINLLPLGVVVSIAEAGGR